MPTRIVFNKPHSPPAQRRSISPTPPHLRHNPITAPINPSSAGLRRNEEEEEEQSHPSRRRSHVERINSKRSKDKQQRTIVTFRSSLGLRALSAARGSLETDALAQESIAEEEETQVETKVVRLSSDDIRASPRLLGYLSTMLAAAVQLVSVVQFYRERIIAGLEEEGGMVTDEYYITPTGLVFRWKLWVAIYMSASTVGLCLLTLLVHFDTIAFPKLWVAVFRDGSKAERNWILFFILVWMGNLHVATSVLSVGEYQANVFFTSWLGFVFITLNYDVWRESAGLVSLADRVNSFHRETTYNWIWVFICSCIFAGSATDMYYNREDVVLRYRGNPLNLQSKDWALVLSIIWTEVAVCLLVIALNETLLGSWQLPCRFKRHNEVFRLVFGWRQIEGIIILVSMGTKFWAILEYTGSGGVINGLSNAYFGIWGSFFNSVFCFGTWLRENKNLESIVKESDVEEGMRQSSRRRTGSNEVGEDPARD